MPRKSQYTPLRVLQNHRLVGHLSKTPGGGISFRYDGTWLLQEEACPVSLSLPLREDAYKGEPVYAVFDNLLPDAETLRRRIAQKVGAAGTDPYNLLSRIGRDCVGALQFIPGDDPGGDQTTDGISGDIVNAGEIERLLKNLAQTPLGLARDQEFRISIAGVQEKTALLFYKDKWWKPHGTTPTTHIFKTQIGTLPNGIDFSNSIENEFYCLKLAAAFGLPVNEAEIRIFGKTKALVIERFDRRWTANGRLLRLPQEDCCQALSIPPGRKYQNEGGPSMVDILNLLKGSDTPAEDQKRFLKAQILYWLLGATDGHAKNFSLFLRPGGRFSMAPLYDILTAQPSLDARQIVGKQLKLAMAVGKQHYAIEYVQPRHFIQTTERAGLPAALAVEALTEIAARAPAAIAAVDTQLPADFPDSIRASVLAGLLARVRKI